MLTINWKKVDKFYLTFILIMIVLSVLVVFTFKNIFSAFIVSNEIDQRDVNADLKIDKTKLDEAYNSVFNKSMTPLELRD